MDTERVLSLIDEITDAGCLHLLITGGEPLLRRDFLEIYCHAKKKGLLITLFTNGTLLTEEIVKLLHDFPPVTVEISLYGATEETYEKITGVKGSFRRCLEGIEDLLDHGIPLKMKTVLMTCNLHEYFMMENLAKKYDVKFRSDPAIFPRFNGDKEPLHLRVSPDDAVDIEFSDRERYNQWIDSFKRWSAPDHRESLYQCGAGVTSFHIDPHGNLKPCLMTNNYSYRLSEGTFLNVWQNEISRIMNVGAGSRYACKQCEKIILCGSCPGFSNLENGSEENHSDYLCSLGEKRFEKILTNR
jgi:radical SAM protein with 4Fe4S-binding SPASM domain